MSDPRSGVTHLASRSPTAPSAGASEPRRARFEDIHARIHDDLWRYCIRRVWPAQDAEDLMAEVLTVVWRRLSDVPEAPDDRPWIFAIARNHVRDRRRTAARRERILQAAAAAGTRAGEPTGHDAADDRLASEQQAALLRTAVRRHSDDDAEILRLAVWEELPHREIATRLGCRENAVTVRLHRARRRLRRHLEALESLEAGTADPRARGPRPTDTSDTTDQPGDPR